MFNEEQLEDATLSILENLGYERLNGYDIDRDYHSVFMDDTLFDDLCRINKGFNDSQLQEAIKTIKTLSHGNPIEDNKTFTKEKSLVLSILGAMGLAVSVNIVELACSAGLPLVFSELLTINNLSGINALLYILIYILFFLIDDIIVFTIAVITMTSNGISSKFNKYSHLVGGIIMLIIGLLLIFKPGWLMFTFK